MYIIAGKKLTKIYRKTEQLNRLIPACVHVHCTHLYTFGPQEFSTLIPATETISNGTENIFSNKFHFKYNKSLLISRRKYFN